SIPEATRERVRAAARSLGYAPHGIARALREGNSRVVVLSIDPHLESNYSRTFARGLDEELAAHGHVLVVRHEHVAPAPERQGRAAPAGGRRVRAAPAPRAVIGPPGTSVAAGHDRGGGGGGGGSAATVLVRVRSLADRGHAAFALALRAGAPPLGPVRMRFA